MPKVGRPTDYKPEFLEKVRAFSGLGLSQQDMANLLGVPPGTFDCWVKRKPEFARAIKEGRSTANASVTRSLFNSALGQMQRIKCPKCLEVFEHRGFGNVVAAIFWLCNRAPEEWKNIQKQQIEIENIPPVTIRPAMTRAFRMSQSKQKFLEKTGGTTEPI